MYVNGLCFQTEAGKKALNCNMNSTMTERFSKQRGHDGVADYNSGYKT